MWKSDLHLQDNQDLPNIATHSIFFVEHFYLLIQNNSNNYCSYNIMGNRVIRDYFWIQKRWINFERFCDEWVWCNNSSHKFPSINLLNRIKIAFECNTFNSTYKI